MAGGILYPTGKIWGDDDNDWQWKNLGYLLGNATDGVLEAAKGRPTPKIVLHSEHGEYGKCQWFFTNLKKRSTYDDYDVIGLSFYPWWQGQRDLENTLTKLKANTNFPGKDVAVVETGYPFTLGLRQGSSLQK